MHNKSKQYIELFNLYQLAKHHKKTCNSPDCNVSIHWAYELAVKLAQNVPITEDITEIMDDFPRY